MVTMLEGVDREYCRKCGTEVFSFSKKTATCDSLSYCVKCAEKLDALYLKNNTCSVCTRLLTRGETRFLLSSNLYSEERLPVDKRIVCTGCYGKVATSAKSRYQFTARARQIKESMRRSLAKRMFNTKNIVPQQA